MSREKTARPMGPHGGHGPMGARMGEKSKDFGGTMKKLIAASVLCKHLYCDYLIGSFGHFDDHGAEDLSKGN